MNEKKICFIICVNNQLYCDECIKYLNKLEVPDGFEVDLLTIQDAESMAKGYNEAMEASDAKYKIYLHQDTFIINTNFLYEIIDIFEKDSQIGGIGVVGGESFLSNDVTRPNELYGNVITMNSYESYISTKYKADYKKHIEIEDSYAGVGCIWSLLFATSVDLAWEELGENDWNYCTVIQSLKMKENGYKLVVPKQDKPWCIHDGNNWGETYKKSFIETLRNRFESLVPQNYSERILFCNSKEIQYPSFVFSLCRLGYNVEVYYEVISCLEYEEEAEKRLEEWITRNDYNVLISYEFASTIAEAAEKAGIKYISWAWDSPLLQYYLPEAKYASSYKFMFDKGEVDRLKEKGLKNIYHLPLVTDTFCSSGLVIDKEDEKKYSHEISFIGQMYFTDLRYKLNTMFSEKNVLKIKNILENDICDWHDYKIIYDKLDDEIFEEYCRNQDSYGNNDFTRGKFEVGMFRNIAYFERVKVLNALAEHYNVDIYTKGDTSELKNVNIHGTASNLSEAPKIFHLSKINLNITVHSIKTGAPLRIFDIMGVGGFVISNYQEELAELFIEDKEIVLFRDIDELLDKVDYYLHHDKQRTLIAMNGYQKVSKLYTYDNAIVKMFDIAGIPKASAESVLYK